VKVKSHIGIHCNEMADQLANYPADECGTTRAFDRDVSVDFAEAFKTNFWLQHLCITQSAEGPIVTHECVRDLETSLRAALHDRHKLGQSNQISPYFQLWEDLSQYRDKQHCDVMWEMGTVSKPARRNAFKYRTG